MPDLSFGSYRLPVYLYEDFSYVISNSASVNLPITKSAGLPSSFFTTTTSNLTFAGNGTSLTAGSTESFSYTTLDGSGSSNTVTVGAGRFTDLCGNGVSGNAYTFYKSEPISNIRLVAPFALSSAVSSAPSLPPGLKFVVSGSNLDISGSPLTTLPTSNYLLIGKDAATGSKIVTTSNTFTVGNERILYNFSGSPIVNMTVDTPIATRALTAAFPPYPSGGTLKYTWNTLPGGINVYDYAGSNRTSSNSVGFSTTDPSHAFVMSGSPTLAAAYQYANAGVSSATYTIQGSRVFPLPAVTSNYPVTFAFNETVLFDQSAIPTLYSGVPVDPSANFFRARTYFATGPGTNISNIFSPDLRADLSLTRVGSNAYLSGAPYLGANTANYTIRATNSNGVTRDYVTPISVQDDSITFVYPTPAIDVCFNFILSRPLDAPKTGYYDYPIQFKAQAASGLPVTLSAAALTGTGMYLDSSGVLSGFPDTVTPLTTLAVVAQATGSPATATRNTKFEVLNDVFTFGSVASSNFQFIQNKAIVPFQIPVTTLSERPLIDFTERLLPSGLNISPAGIISGTPLSTDVSGTMEIIPTTGYTSGSNFYNYTLTPDSILFTSGPHTHYRYIAGDPVTIPITGTAYSGTSVTNYDLSLSPTYGLSIGSSSGLITGPWTTSIPPQTLLPASCNFTVNATAGGLVGSLGANMTVDPIVENKAFMAPWGMNVSNTRSVLYDSTDYSSWRPTTSSNTIVATPPDGSMSEIQFKNNDVDGNTAIIATNSRYLFRGDSISNLVYMYIDSSPSWPDIAISTLANKTGTSTWYGVGSNTKVSVMTGLSIFATIIKSDDDGLTWQIPNVGITILGAPFFTRDLLPGITISNNPYITAGACLRYKDEVLMIGGTSSGTALYTMGRSVDYGSTWYPVVHPLQKELAYYNLDASDMWIATGSSLYQTGSSGLTYTSNADTIKYSDDLGATWNTTSGGFNMFGYEVVYGSNVWLATGVSCVIPDIYKPNDKNHLVELRYSTDGMKWSNTGIVITYYNESVPPPPPLPIGSLAFDGTYWNVIVNVSTPNNPDIRRYRHSATPPFNSGWSIQSVPGFSSPMWSLPDIDSLRFLSLTPPKYVKSGPGDITIDLTFSTNTTSGPTFTSPTITSYLLYQYIGITRIQLAATGTGQVYFFVTTDDLPPGLAFDPVTNQIYGTPAEMGKTSTTIRAKDDIGVTEFVLNFTVIIPRIIRKQDGAGAYTSLLRQYTNVLGAQNAVNSRVLPNPRLGEFMAPDAPDVVLATIDPKCRDPNC